jgi:hypothetical protein
MTFLDSDSKYFKVESINCLKIYENTMFTKKGVLACIKKCVKLISPETLLSYL